MSFWLLLGYDGRRRTTRRRRRRVGRRKRSAWLGLGGAGHAARAGRRAGASVVGVCDDVDGLPVGGSVRAWLELGLGP